MTAVAVEFHPVSIDSVKRLAKVHGACLSIYLPPYQQGSSEARGDIMLRTFINTAEGLLARRGMSPTDLENLLQPIRAFQTQDERLQHGRSESLAIFRAPGFLEVYSVPAELQPGVFVEAAFQVIPLLEFTSTPHDIWVMALTRKGVRLLHNGRPAALPATVPATLEEFLALAPPDHRLDNRSAAGPSVGRMRGVPFGTGSELEASNRHFRDYCLAIDRGLAAMFVHSKPPVVLAGAIAELSIYRRISTYPRLLPKSIVRSPDDGMLSDDELNVAAADLLLQDPSPAELRANAHVFGAIGSSRILTELNALVRASARGKVGEVFISTGLAEMGDVDNITGKVRVEGELVASEDDLYNAVAIETLNHSGEVFVVPPDRIPGGFGAVGALRY